MKPYQQVLITECGEPLIPIPLEQFAIASPHLYQQLGAPYGERSPFYLRATVLENLIKAQNFLQQKYPGWQIEIFDAYRPVEVQQFMVDYTLNQLAHEQGLILANLTPSQSETLLEKVYQFWAKPSFDLATPPPHSTGAAIDVTLVDNYGNPIDMGSPIDEISPRSIPDYFRNSQEPTQQKYHQHRQLLYEIMNLAGFQRHPNEWWHFSFGDQMWVWLSNQSNLNHHVTARYGRVS